MADVGEFLEEFEFGEGRTGPPAVRSFESISQIFGSGVYALTLNGNIVYIGKAKILIQRLYAHWNTLCRMKSGKELPERVNPIMFTGAKVIFCPPHDLDRLERQMIAKYRPSKNTRLVPSGKVTLEQIGFDLTRLGVNVVAETPVYRRRL
jgi:hypothetical protein